jgi:hypothetical protein
MNLTVPISTGATAIGAGLVIAYLAVEGLGGKWYNMQSPAEREAYYDEQRRNNLMLLGGLTALVGAGYVFGGKYPGTIGRGVMYGVGGWLAVAAVSSVQDEMKRAART